LYYPVSADVHLYAFFTADA